MRYVAFHIAMDDEPSAGQPMIGHGVEKEHFEQKDRRGTDSYPPKGQIGIDAGEIVGQPPCS